MWKSLLHSTHTKSANKFLSRDIKFNKGIVSFLVWNSSRHPTNDLSSEGNRIRMYAVITKGQGYYLDSKLYQLSSLQPDFAAFSSDFLFIIK